MIGPALCAVAPEEMVSISNEMAAALSIKERSRSAPHTRRFPQPEKAILVTHDTSCERSCGPALRYFFVTISSVGLCR